jgi:hypothetical protein
MFAIIDAREVLTHTNEITMFAIIDAREVLTHTNEITTNKTRFIIATAGKPGSTQMHQAMLTSPHNCLLYLTSYCFTS